MHILKNQKAIAIAGVLVLALSGCAEKAKTKKAEITKSEIKKPSGPPLKIKSVETRVVKAGNEFGFDLLRRIDTKKSNANLLISPFSLSSALAMTYNGAAGATQKEMAQTLRLGVLPLTQINAANAALKFNLSKAIPHNDPRLQIEIANSLWAKKGGDFDKSFLARNKQFYDAKISSLDLSTPSAFVSMDAWVKESTKGKIQRILDVMPDENDSLILMNAVYFNGKWQSQFDESETRDAPFYLSNGEKKQVPMMSQEERFSYAKHKDCATLILPYGNGAMSLMLVLPDKNVAVNSIVSQLSTSQWDNWQGQMMPRPGTISIPRFKMNAETDFSDALFKMGMKSAFTEEIADFSKMRPQSDLFLSDVRQKAIIEVNEEGTEAAAVTEATASNTTSVDADTPFEFIADRPFLGAIYDTQSGAILFLMIVRQP